jgi:hypothetical protein
MLLELEIFGLIAKAYKATVRFGNSCVNAGTGELP